jgi:alanyl-tRNA synthetase
MPLIQAIEKLSGISYASAGDRQPAFHVLADHIRSTCMIIADGGTPSNEGRGYVIRKIIRRAALFAHKLGDITLFPRLAPTFIAQMGELYPALHEGKALICRLIEDEVDRFADKLASGQQLFEKMVGKVGDVVGGADAFKLYDTYGFPLELTKVLAHDRGMHVDEAGFEQHMEKQRAQSGKKDISAVQLELPSELSTTFTGYASLETTSPILALIVDGTLVEQVPAGSYCGIITKESPFYVECGGQISDEGVVRAATHDAKLEKLVKQGGVIIAYCHAPTTLRVGMLVTQRVDEQKRLRTMKNHTATHLLQSALIAVLGSHIKQAGSLVAPDYLRFDFNAQELPTAEQIAAVEQHVNDVIMRNIPLAVENTTLASAQERGVIAFFGEKYNPESVRVVMVPGVSAELCGGTHVRATGDIGLFKITEVSSLSAGVKRLVALTGPAALQLFNQSFSLLKQLATECKVQPTQLPVAFGKLQQQLKETERQTQTIKQSFIRVSAPTWISGAKQIKGEKGGTLEFIYALFGELFTAEDVRLAVQQIAQQKPQAFIFVLANAAGAGPARITYAASVPAGLDVAGVKQMLTSLGLRGGGSGAQLTGGGVYDSSRLADDIAHALAKLV